MIIGKATAIGFAIYLFIVGCMTAYKVDENDK